MILIKTKLGVSKISGIGLFADEFIKKGTIVWEFNRNIDILLSEEDMKNLSESSRNQIDNYSYIDKKLNKYLLCGDDARFFNHSDDPNCSDDVIDEPDLTIANRDINIGDELTCNYKTFYSNIDDHIDKLK